MKCLPSRCKAAAVLLAILLVAGSAGFANAKSANAPLIPAKSAYVVSVPDVPSCYSAWKQNAIYVAYRKVMESPEIGSQLAFFNRQLDTIEKALGFPLNGETISQISKSIDIYVVPGETAGTATAGIILQIADKSKLEKLIDLAEKAAATAASNVSEEPEESRKPEPNKTNPSPAKDTDKKESGNTMGGAEDTAAKSAPATDDKPSSSSKDEVVNPITRSEYKGVTIKRFSGKADQESFYAISGDLLLASNEEPEIKRLIDASKAGATADAGALASSADYKTIENALAGHAGEFYVLVNQKQVMEIQHSQPGMEKLRSLLTRFSPSGMSGVSVKISPNDIAAYSCAPLGEGPDGAALRALFEKNPATKPLEVLSFAPADSIIACGTNLVDAKLYYQIFSELTSAVSSMPGGDNKIEDQIHEAEKQLGFSIKDDLIPALGNEAALFLNSVQIGGRMLPSVDAAVVLKIQDKAKITKVLAGIEKFATAMMSAAGASTTGDDKDAKKAPAGGMKTATVGKTTLKYFDIPGVDTYKPGFAVAGDYLVIGTTRSGIEKMLELKSGTGDALAASANVKALAPRVTTTANSFTYLNFGPVWPLVTALGSSLSGNEAAGKVLDSLKVMRAIGSSEVSKENVVISQSVILLGRVGQAFRPVQDKSAMRYMPGPDLGTARRT